MEEYRLSGEEQRRVLQRHRGEMADYMAYMDKRREEQARQEREMDRLIEEDVKREELKRDQQWERERAGARPAHAAGVPRTPTAA